MEIGLFKYVCNSEQLFPGYVVNWTEENVFETRLWLMDLFEFTIRLNSCQQ